MKLVTFVSGAGDRLGALIDGNRIVDLNAASGVRSRTTGSTDPLPSSMLALLEMGEPGMATARATVEWFVRQPVSQPGVEFSLAEVRLQPPVPRPGKMICMGHNFAGHAAEAAETRRKAGVETVDVQFPHGFLKVSSSLIGDGAPIMRWPEVAKLDYEVEVAVIIGRPCRNVPPSEALSYVAGYTIFNDVTARDLQYRELHQGGSVKYGKNMDSFGPMGPVMVTADEVPDPHEFPLRLLVNGQVRQNSSTNCMLFGFDQLIAHWSALMTLQPGDMIASGTPEGVAAHHKPDPQEWFLQPGDEVVAEVDGIGRLRNRVRDSVGSNQ